MSMNAARTAVATERRRLNEQLIIALGELKGLNRTRGPLGHGVIVRHNVEATRSGLEARIDGIRADLARLA